MAKIGKLCDVKVYLKGTITDSDGNINRDIAKINYLTEEETIAMLKMVEVATGDTFIKLDCVSRLIEREDYDDIERAYQCVIVRASDILYIDVIDSDADEE
jgi:hypothetical protein